MKIKLAILEEDTTYLNRIVSVFNTKYSEQIEVYSFTVPEMALHTIHERKIDFLLADDGFEIDAEKLPQRCSFAYLVDSRDVEMLKGQYAIARFQRVDVIYKQILGIYAENNDTILTAHGANDRCRVLMFGSPCGGMGCSTVAAACAKHFAIQGKRVLYLDLDPCGDADIFFSGEGQSGLSELIFALKRKKSNLLIKLESCVRQDASGVCFYSRAQNVWDVLELTVEEIVQLIEEIKLSDLYDLIILDIPFRFEKQYECLYQLLNNIILISDGTEIANAKTLRAIEALKIKEANEETDILGKLALLYNRFGSRSGTTMEISDIKNVGGINRHEGASAASVMNSISAMDVFESFA